MPWQIQGWSGPTRNPVSPDVLRILAQRAPTPLARLAERAQNDPSTVRQHHVSYYVFEMWLRIVGAIAASRYRQSKQRTPTLEEALRALTQPSVGTVLAFVLAYARSFPRDEIASAFATRLTSNMLPGYRWACANGGRAMRDGPTIAEFAQALVAYRNKHIGHGAIQPPEFYRDGATALFGSIGALVLAATDSLGGRLLVVEEVNEAIDGERVAVVFELAGSLKTRLAEPRAGSQLPDLRRGAVYFAVGDNVPSNLFPWLMWEDDFVQVLSAATKSKIEYLNYNTGAITTHQTSHIAALRAVLDTAGGGLPERVERKKRPGHWIGDYELCRVLGRGGMGIVYHARQDSTDMPVALKVLPDQLVRDDVTRARFRREVQILSRSQHPNIISILDSGEADGVYFYAMELVNGCTLAELYSVFTNVPSDARLRLTSSHLLGAIKRIAASHPFPSTSLPPPPPVASESDATHAAAARSIATDVLNVSANGGEELWKLLLLRFAEVADALAHLHGRGIIHRDIKPSNIMLTEDGARSVLMDLGIAKMGTDSVHTKTNTFVGTLRYASREQALRSLDELTPASDLYSLGATMYELFTMTPLYGEDESSVSKMTDGALLRKILDERPAPVRERNPSLKPELGIVLEKLLEKQSDRRFYASATELAVDLRNIYYQRPLSARDYTPDERRSFELFDSMRAQALTWSTERRPRDLLWGEERCTELVSLDVGRRFELTAVERDFLEATSQHALELRQAREAREAHDRRTEEELLARGLDAARQRRWLRRAIGVFVFSTLLIVGVAGVSEKLTISADREARAVIGRKAAEQTRNAALDGEAMHLLEKARRAEREARWDDALLFASQALGSSESSEIATPARGTLEREAAVPVRTFRVWTGKQGSGVHALAFSPDGAWLAVANDQHGLIVSPVRADQGVVGDGPRIAIGDASGARASPRAWSVAFAPDGATLGVGSEDGSVELWDTRTWTRDLRWVASHRTIRSVSFTRDSRQILAGGDDGVLHSRMIGDRPGVDRLIDSGTEIYALALSNDGMLAAVAREDATIELLGAPSWKRIRVFPRHDGVVRALTFAGQALLSGSEDGFARSWDCSDETQSGWKSLSDHEEKEVYAVAATDDGTLAASAGEANAVHISDVKLLRDLRVLANFPDEVNALAFARDGATLAIGLDDGTIDIRRVERSVSTGPSPLLGHTRAVENLAFWDGRLVSSGDDNKILIWNPKTGGKDEVAHVNGVTAALAARGRTLAMGERGGLIRIRSVDGLQSSIQTHAKDVTGLAISPDESLIAVGGAKGGTVVLCERATRGHCVRWKAHGDRTNEVAFSPDGGWLASAGDDPGVVLWRVAERRMLTGDDVDQMDTAGIALPGSGPSFDVSFSHDGLRVAAGARDGTVRVWDTRAMMLIQTLEGSEERVFGIDFSPDDRFLASASKDSTVRVWDTLSWTPRVLRAHVAGAYVVRFSPDGRALASAGADKTIRLWDTATWTELGARSPRFGSGPDDGNLLSTVSLATGLCLHSGVPHYLRYGEACAGR
jgi:WD40 repeat protein/serine/threonine protein kinase